MDEENVNSSLQILTMHCSAYCTQIYCCGIVTPHHNMYCIVEFLAICSPADTLIVILSIMISSDQFLITIYRFLMIISPHNSPSIEPPISFTGYKIPVLENLGATLDQFDTIDLSDNEIRKLDGFPLLRRLKTLLMNNNRIW